MEDDLKKMKNGDNPETNKKLFSIPRKFRGKPFQGWLSSLRFYSHYKYIK